jgi:hypothetical protein
VSAECRPRIETKTRSDHFAWPPIPIASAKLRFLAGSARPKM